MSKFPDLDDLVIKYDQVLEKAQSSQKKEDWQELDIIRLQIEAISSSA